MSDGGPAEETTPSSRPHVDVDRQEAKAEHDATTQTPETRHIRPPAPQLPRTPPTLTEDRLLGGRRRVGHLRLLNGASRGNLGERVFLLLLSE